MYRHDWRMHHRSDGMLSECHRGQNGNTNEWQETDKRGTASRELHNLTSMEERK